MALVLKSFEGGFCVGRPDGGPPSSLTCAAVAFPGDPTKAALPLRSVSRWECCLPLGCLILHVSAKAARELCFQCRIPMPSPGEQKREEKPGQRAAVAEGGGEVRQPPSSVFSGTCPARRLLRHSLTWALKRPPLSALPCSSPSQPWCPEGPG